jgi:predicted metalloprotease with PDZ domain
LTSTEDPPLEQLLLSEVGLRLEPLRPTVVALGWQLEQRPAGGLWVTRTSRGGAAQQAGLQVGDELIALGQERVRQQDDLNQLLASAVPDQPLELLVSREGLLRRYTLHPGPAKPERWQLRVDADAPPPVHQRRDAWLQLRP